MPQTSEAVHDEDWEEWQLDDTSSDPQTKPVSKTASPLREDKSETSPVVQASHATSSTPATEPVSPSAGLWELVPGQRFPLTKTVDQRLTQWVGQQSIVNISRLELQLSLTVEDVRDHRCRLGVQYHRVRWYQQLEGEVQEYRSDQPSETVPSAAWPYVGLLHNGFSFWLNERRELTELLGFEEFLQRCAQRIPEPQRSAWWTTMRQLPLGDVIMQFVDDSLTLVPPIPTPWNVGQRWQRPLRTRSQGPQLQISVCQIKEITSQVVELHVWGHSDPLTIYDDAQRIQLHFQRGECSGTCALDRRTGLPQRSRIERIFDMVAQLPDGSTVPQRQETITTCWSYQEQAAPTTAVWNFLPGSRSAAEVQPSAATSIAPPRAP